MMKTIDTHAVSLEARELRGAYLAQSLSAVAKVALAVLAAKAVGLSHAFTA